MQWICPIAGSRYELKCDLQIKSFRHPTDCKKTLKAMFFPHRADHLERRSVFA